MPAAASRPLSPLLSMHDAHAARCDARALTLATLPALCRPLGTFLCWTRRLGTSSLG